MRVCQQQWVLMTLIIAYIGQVYYGCHAMLGDYICFCFVGMAEVLWNGLTAIHPIKKRPNGNRPDIAYSMKLSNNVWSW